MSDIIFLTFFTPFCVGLMFFIHYLARYYSLKTRRKNDAFMETMQNEITEIQSELENSKGVKRCISYYHVADGKTYLIYDPEKEEFFKKEQHGLLSSEASMISSELEKMIFVYYYLNTGSCSFECDFTNILDFNTLINDLIRFKSLDALDVINMNLSYTDILND